MSYDSEEWRDEALCAQTDPDLFVIDHGGSSAQARLICRECVVADLCLQWALDTNEQYGIYGGLSPRQRHKLKGLSA